MKGRKKEIPGFTVVCKSLGLPEPTPEYVFAPPRKWRLDWAWPADKIAVEVEGGAWIGGRHTRGAGYVKDMEKYNTAALLGWLLLRVTPQQISSGVAFGLLERAFKKGKGNQ